LPKTRQQQLVQVPDSVDHQGRYPCRYNSLYSPQRDAIQNLTKGDPTDHDLPEIVWEKLKYNIYCIYYPQRFSTSSLHFIGYLTKATVVLASV
jgi:hypothetical protein